jgi:hypothetical protein
MTMNWRRPAERTRAMGTATVGAAVVGAVLALGACGGSSSTAGPGASTAPITDAGPTSTTGGAPVRPTPKPTPRQTESNPSGDIPDQQVFVAYSPPKAHFSVKVPEGWARSQTPAGVRFTDKLNSITVREAPAPAATSAASAASAASAVVPQLAAQVPAFAPGKVSTVTRTGGPAVLITYLTDSAPDQVTDKVVRDAVECYSFWRAGHEVVLTLSGPSGADNVDPWKIVTDSLRWR